MRQIKFRYYDKKNKQMRDWNYVKRYQMAALEDNSDRESYSPWMQYTGLKDRQGVGIFEGDIVSSFVPNRESTGAIIDYDDEITVFYDIRTAPDQFVFLVEPRVIGNIYENSELLERD